ncbi:MAG: CotH kinase family protein [Clostridia bacterium]|nr:CotH kinase family protein [Clostridia bacterium]
MKKIISILLAASIIFGCFAFEAFAADDKGFTVYNPDTDNIAFDVKYPEIGKKITVSVKDREGEAFLYKWFIDNNQVNDFTDSYTPVDGDNEKMLTVKVYDTDCELVGEKSVFISSLPVVYIETESRKPVVSKTDYLNANMKIQGNSEFDDSSVLYEGKTEIKGRGNSTWYSEKKPYKLKLNSKSDLFGMGKSKHWVLLSNPYDSSNMRNDVSYKLSEDMGLNTQKCVWVELVLNGCHVGLYQLVEHVRIEENRVNITKWDDIAEDAAKAIYKKNTDIMTKAERDELIDIMTENMNWVTTDTVTYKNNSFKVSDYYSVPSITGGYLIEASVDVSPNGFVVPSGLKLVVDEPEGIGAGMKEYISGYYSALDKALFSNDYCTEYQGKTMRYSDFIDVESFAKGILINEIFENSDFGTKSTWMSKDIDGKIVFGPIWDMDYTTISSFNVWTTAKKAWIKRILSDPMFMNVVRNIYFEYRYTAIQDIIKNGGYFDSAYDKITDAAIKNDRLWNNSLLFEDNADDFRIRLQRKIKWLDEQFKTLDSALASVAVKNNYSQFINSTDLELTLDNDSLTVKPSNTVSTIKVFSDGNLIQTIDNPLEKNTVNLGDAADGIITVYAYDSNGIAVAGKNAANQKSVSALTVKQKSGDKKYAVGESVNADDFVLTATFTDGSSENVMPSLIYTYAKDSLASQRFCDGKVTDKAGKVYAVFMYGNNSTEIQLNVLPTEDYLTVESFISEIPNDYSDKDFFKALFEAQTRYEKLSNAAKAKVSNYSVLNSAMQKLNDAASADDVSVIGCYSDGAMRADAKNNIVVLVKGTSRSLIVKYPDSSKSTYGKVSKNVLSVKETSGYELWTINQTVNSGIEYFDMYATYPTGSQRASIRVYVKDLLVNNTREYEETPIEPLMTGNVFYTQCPDEPVSDGISVKLITDDAVNNVNIVSGDKTVELSPSVEKNGYKIWNGTIADDNEYSIYVEGKLAAQSIKFNAVKGDVNFDMTINSFDALLVMQHSVGITTLSELQQKCADVMENGTVNSADALLILQYSVGMRDKL